MKVLRDCLEREPGRDMREMKTSMFFMNEKFEEMKGLLQSAIGDSVELKKESEVLKKECDDLRNKVKEDEIRTTDCEQYRRRWNLEVKVIPGRTYTGVWPYGHVSYV